MTGKTLPDTVSGEELRWLLGDLTAARISQLASEGVITRVGRGRYTLASVPAVIKAMRDRSDGPSDWQRERTRFMASKARTAEREERKAAGELSETALVIKDWSGILQALATHFRGMPIQLAPRVILCRTEAEAFEIMSEVVEQHIEEAINAPLTFRDEEQNGKSVPRRNGKSGGKSALGEVGKS